MGMQLFTFDIKDPLTDQIQVEVKHHSDSTKEPKVLGVTNVDVSQLKIGELKRVLLDLSDKKTGKSAGVLSLVLKPERGPFEHGTPHEFPSPSRAATSQPASPD